MSETMKLPRYSLSIRNERELRGWSQSRLAEELGTTPGTISNWERGIITPSAYFRERLCQVFGKNAAQLGLLSESDARLETPAAADRGQITAGQESWSKRERFLERVASIWIRDLLEPSLATLPGLSLRLAQLPHAVLRPHETTWGGSSKEAAILLPESATLLDCYHEALGELLVLGEPGSGKTTQLLLLLQALIERAHRDEMHPLPVLFPLASWGQKQLPLSAWMLQELQRLYHVPRRLGQAWLEAEQILPLLDGLDEVPTALRSACIRAINAYREEHGLLPTVVCCRSGAYFAQAERLCLQSAVVIRSLPPEYVRSYLAAEQDCHELAAAIEHMPSLQEVLTTPLMLMLIKATLQASNEQNSPSAGPLEQHLQSTIASYIRLMIERRTARQRYTPAQLRRWLTWIAQQLLLQSRAEFALEQLQASWLPERTLARRLWKPVTGLLNGLAQGLSNALLFVFILVNQLNTEQTLRAYLGPALIGGAATGVAMSYLPAGGQRWRRLLYALLTGVFFGLTFGLTLGLEAGLTFSLVSSLLAWLGVVRHFAGTIEATEAISWSWTTLQRRLKRYWPKVLLGESLIGLGFAIVIGLSKPLRETAGTTLFLLLLIGLCCVLIGGFLGGISWRTLTLTEVKLSLPAEGIWYSGRNALLLGTLSALASASLLTVAFMLIFWIGQIIASLTGPLSLVEIPDPLQIPLPVLLVLTLLPSAAISLALVWNSGGAAFIQHWLLRLLLWRTGCLPLRAAAFLECATDRALLRRVGGSYVFFHRLLLEHFARNGSAD